MKLSENTLDVLKNFATINQGIVVKPGKILRTISSNKAILAEANVEEEFDTEFGLYDLHKVLSVVDKNSPEVVFEKDSLVFTSVGKIRIRYTASSLILAPPNKSINIPSYDVKIQLTDAVLKWVFGMAAVLKCPNIVVKSDAKGGDINIWAMDVKGEIVDDANVKVGENAETAFQAVLKVENLKILPGSYDVEISSVGVSKFKHSTKDLTYWIAIEQASSTFSKE
ncbi:sliding clamp [uncultured Caudovirales phage]|uniref:Sliding clamp n=1 Tax=uncultured Caudovirales phage TaxID=2100421 RepID=A0A6J5KWI4_9CAUD|nr:sliding clamp [uncultured Caudovirales phage]